MTRLLPNYRYRRFTTLIAILSFFSMVLSTASAVQAYAPRNIGQKKHSLKQVSSLRAKRLKADRLKSVEAAKTQTLHPQRLKSSRQPRTSFGHR